MTKNVITSRGVPGGKTKEKVKDKGKTQNKEMKTWK